VVQPDKQRHGVSRTLIADFEGSVIVGVIPDANGLGKPDILMAKDVIMCEIRPRQGNSVTLPIIYSVFLSAILSKLRGDPRHDMEETERALE
jgi:hypothetical protein